MNVTIEFPNGQMARIFLTWFCEIGEQEFMEDTFNIEKIDEYFEYDFDNFSCWYKDLEV